VSDEAFQSPLPELSMEIKPFGRLFHRRGARTEAMDAPPLLPAREAGPLQCAQALRDGRKRDAKRGGQTRDGGLSPGKP